MYFTDPDVPQKQDTGKVLERKSDHQKGPQSFAGIANHMRFGNSWLEYTCDWKHHSHSVVGDVIVGIEPDVQLVWSGAMGWFTRHKTHSSDLLSIIENYMITRWATEPLRGRAAS